MSFEKRVEHYLEYSGWERFGTNSWKREGLVYWSGWHFPLIQQLRDDYDKHGDIERAAEILERSR